MNVFETKKKSILALILSLLLVLTSFVLVGCGDDSQNGDSGSSIKSSEESHNSGKIDKDGVYDSKEDVKDYLVEYGELPGNYMTKNEARDLGWEGGSLERYAKGKCIGGDRFGNYEGNLPKEKDRDFYHECDIDTLGKSGRGAKRIIYGKDGDIYYTDDHYDSFTKIYDAE